MGKKLKILKEQGTYNSYFEYEHEYEFDENEVYFDVWEIVWHDFERCYCCELKDMSFNEIKNKYLEFEKDWTEMEPNFGLYSDRDPETGMLL